MKRSKGHTLAEVSACVAICAITACITLPQLTPMLEKGKQAEAVNLMVGALHYARGAAVLGRARVSLCSGQLSCNSTKRWAGDLLIFSDPNKSGQLENPEFPLKHIQIPPDYSWHWSNYRSATYLQYESDGTTRALNGTLTLCHEGLPVRQVVINSAGRIRTQLPGIATRC